MGHTPINSALDALQSIIVECSDPEPVAGGTLALVRNLAERGVVCEKARQASERRDLLDKIDPPKAPTLDEALQLLEVVRGECGLGENYGGKVDALLDRARRAQVTP